ncbi:hypothetical protein F9C28_05180 [Shimwellia pseudoproteus]|uniref:hypothetical protein n=1 Tax=Shimwellia pseudoproteus TaxID=570012 RepID=UPI0018ECE59B|nr:hypothetical protein [Shimwellia pseudoproteus]MBJ3814336.1 hypothetical protein [Shimwellia pseudoproteus]
MTSGNIINYEQETKIFYDIILKAICSADTREAFTMLRNAIDKIPLPEPVRELCEKALLEYRPGRNGQDQSVAIGYLLKAYENISGYRHIENYIMLRNKRLFSPGLADE